MLLPPPVRNRSPVFFPHPLDLSPSAAHAAASGGDAGGRKGRDPTAGGRAGIGPERVSVGLDTFSPARSRSCHHSCPRRNPCARTPTLPSTSCCSTPTRGRANLRPLQGGCRLASSSHPDQTSSSPKKTELDRILHPAATKSISRKQRRLPHPAGGTEPPAFEIPAHKSGTLSLSPCHRRLPI
jgi:hypothetical protein